ncbi:MAG TPA: hypothetical protein VFT22_35495 [Kofleriaceae bacterium]|nr:hypothetical protein [Kofleriaceae bacterium]
MNRIALVRFTLVAAVGMGTIGCLGSTGKASGGGWMPSVVTGEIATFGFHTKCEDSLGKSSLMYFDHGAEVAINVDQLALDETTHANTVCDVVALDQFTGGAAFVGNYVPIPTTAGQGGLIVVAYADNGLPGPSNEDAMIISLQGGIFDGYSNAQLISAGQVTIVPEE